MRHVDDMCVSFVDASERSWCLDPTPYPLGPNNLSSNHLTSSSPARRARIVSMSLFMSCYMSLNINIHINIYGVLSSAFMYVL
jgi:hypothetical protein